MSEAPPRTGPSKGPAAFRTISEASAELEVPQHVLRFWETRFTFIRPTKRAGGRRFYRPQDLEVLRGVRRLLQDDGYTIKGVQKLHKEQGLRRLLAAAGVGEDAARALEAEHEDDAPAAAAPAPAPRAEPPPAPPVEAESGRDEETYDLFGGAPPPAEPQGAAAPPPTEPPAGLAARPILQPQARVRLTEVLGDLEATKAAIDALLVEA